MSHGGSHVWSMDTSSYTASWVEVATAALAAAGVGDALSLSIHRVVSRVTTIRTKANLVRENRVVESAVLPHAKALLRRTAGVATSTGTNLNTLTAEAVVTSDAIIVAVRTSLALDASAASNDSSIRNTGSRRQGRRTFGYDQLGAFLTLRATRLGQRVTGFIDSATGSAIGKKVGKGPVNGIIAGGNGQGTRCCKN